LNTEKKIALTIFCIFFVLYVFTNDGHRHTIDEELTLRQATWLTTLTPHPDFKLGESREMFDFPELFSYPGGEEKMNSNPLCKIGLLCSPTSIGHSIVEVPFLFLNEHLNIISEDDIWSTNDFDDQHYVWWRNSIPSNHVFLELFYGPLFSAISVSLFFFVSRSFNITLRNSIIVTLLFGLSTITWAYSQTSLNSVSMITFILLGFLFFRKYQKENSSLYLIISGFSLGFGFIIRLDSFIILTPIFFFLIGFLIYKNFLKRDLVDSIKKISSFSIPLFLSYGFFQFISYIRFENTASYSGFTTIISSPDIFTPLPISLFGLLFSPGIGLFIFSPILFLVIVSFSDLFKKNKQDFILLLGIILSFLVFYSQFVVYWHGLSGWSARYLLPIIPFLLIPLGITLGRKLTKGPILVICFLGALGIFVNLVYLVQDTNWFVWGLMGNSDHGLYSLHGGPLRIHPLTIWSFEFSQLTHSIFMAFVHLQLDIYLLKVLGTSIYCVILVGLLGMLSYNLIRLYRSIVVKMKN
tara:strand:+ start:1291 stop:2862 length:1572 start_codon:yes stop_codon:yes gene_type:complete